MNDAVALATQAQNTSAHPQYSTFVSANAGSGKTTILTNRIARLLLAGNAPQSILCLTFTKAAAGEVQERIFKTLGEWVLMPSGDLREVLAKIGEQNVNDQELSQARKLFAKALETPSGLKVQTIHAFSASVLKRFPLEAGVPPGFREIDDSEALLLGMNALNKTIEAHSDLARQIAKNKNLNESFLSEILDHRYGFRPKWQVEDFARHFNRQWDVTKEAVFAEFCAYGTDEQKQAWFQSVDRFAKNAYEKFQTEQAAQIQDLSTIWSLIHKTDGALRNKLPAPETKFQSPEPNFGGLVSLILDKVEPAIDHEYFSKMVPLHQFAALVLDNYAHEKSLRLVLDYDDLIERTAQLLNQNNRLNWVMYRLDGAIHHILVDEAQDTNAAQWGIIDALANAVGHDPETSRTLFVVGDEKQSIYSFQGADPEVFDAKRGDYRQLLNERGEVLQEEELLVSFRSSPLILRFVDAVFHEDNRKGLGHQIRHMARAEDIPGRIEILPYRFKTHKKSKIEFPEIGVSPQSSEELILAHDIAEKIASDLQSGRMIKDGDKWRAVEPGDYLILLRKRRSFFYAIQKYLQEKGIPIAGVDSLTLNDELVIRDIMALFRALHSPFDDLSLACFLRSPMGGLSETELYEIAHNREDQSLLEALKNHRDQYADALAIYEDLQSHVDFIRPHDLLERLLYHHQGAAKFRARLGEVVEDVLRSMMDVAVSYEGKETPSLTGFIAWFERQNITLKRPLGETHGAVRTMTVHGAKGLEAPIVVLPFVEDKTANDGSIIELDGVNLVKGKFAQLGATMQNRIKDLQSKNAEEDNRLLYVALTRARSALLICGAGQPKSKTQDEFPDGHIYPILMDAALKLPGSSNDAENGILVEHHWAHEHVPSEIEHKTALRQVEFPKLKTMSSAGAVGLSDLLPEYDKGKGRGAEFGVLYHEMMEALPRWSKLEWAKAAAERWGEHPRFAECYDEVARSFENFPIFLHEPSLRETEFLLHLDGRQIAGRIDQIILADEAMIVDYKTNLDMTEHWADLHPNYQMQLAVYQKAIEEKSGRSLRAAVFSSVKQVMIEAKSGELQQAYEEFRSLIKK